MNIDSNFAAENGPSYTDHKLALPDGFTLASDEALSEPHLHVRLYGDSSRPKVIVSGGISSGRGILTTLDEKGWWPDLVGPGEAIDTERFCIIGFDFLPNEGEKARTLSTADQAQALLAGLDALGVQKVRAFVGASYGGMTALALAEADQERCEKLVIISAADRPHPTATAIRGVQRRIIQLAGRLGEGAEGVSLARQLAMISYRSPEEFEQRFDYAPGAQAGDPYAVCDYLISRGAAYGMDPARYITLSDSVDRHCVDTRKIAVPCLLLGATTDRLVPLNDMRRLADDLNHAELFEFYSLFGHDAFLKENAVIGPKIKAFLEDGKA